MKTDVIQVILINLNRNEPDYNQLLISDLKEDVEIYFVDLKNFEYFNINIDDFLSLNQKIIYQEENIHLLKVINPCTELKLLYFQLSEFNILDIITIGVKQ